MVGTCCCTSWRFCNLTFLLLSTGSVALWIVPALWRLHHLGFQLYLRGQQLQEGLFIRSIRPAVRTEAFLDSVLYKPEASLLRHWTSPFLTSSTCNSSHTIAIGIIFDLLISGDSLTSVPMAHLHAPRTDFLLYELVITHLKVWTPRR